MNESPSLLDFMAKCHNDPLLFVQGAFNWQNGESPDKWQENLLREIADNTSKSSLRFAVASGHGIGKSTLVAWLILWAMSTRPHLAGVITANTAAQLKDKTWRELSIWHKRAINAHWFVQTATKFYQADNPETWFVSAVAWSKERPEAFAGLHAENVLMIFDEASAIDDVIYETAEGAMTTSGAMWFIFGNPTRNRGKFHEIHHRLRHRWRCRQIDSRTAKMTNKAELAKWVADYGEDSDFVRVRIKGEFPRTGSRQLISGEIVENAVKRKLEPDKYAPKIIGVDVARFGEDCSVIICRHGGVVVDIQRFRKIDTMELSARAAEIASVWGADMIFADAGGVGGGVVDRLRQLGFGVIGVEFGGRAMDDSKYFNKRAEIWCLMKDWLAAGSIPDDRELIIDLTSPEYGFSGDKGQIQLEKKEDMKKRGLASPDSADALALTFAVPISSKALFESEYGNYHDTIRGW